MVNLMRVIAGKARRIQLKTVPGMETRPTTDRIKETLFNILQPELYRACFLDLFSGSGAIGIEALSRGCEMAVFVENNRNAVDCIRDNLNATHLSAGALILQKDVSMALQQLEKEGKCFDIIFMDPPYNHLIEKRVLEQLSGSGLVHKDTWIVVEASLQTDFSYIEDSCYALVREKIYKTNKHIFLKIK
jgi:16S rRNA (guanine(966)-N(2))-methyltransferase RsmD